MNTSVDIMTTLVSVAMTQSVITVRPSDNMDHVSDLFCENNIHAAPVVDEMNHCIGIITSTDLNRFRTERDTTSSPLNRGLDFDASHRHWDGTIDLVPLPFDEVQQQMSSWIQTIRGSDTLKTASIIMHEQHIHHLIVLSESQIPIGILSSLDILRELSRLE